MLYIYTAVLGFTNQTDAWSFTVEMTPPVILLFAILFFTHGTNCLLKPAYGINFRHVGKLQPTADRHFLTLDVVIPRPTRTFDNDWIINFNCDDLRFKLNDFSMRICRDFEPNFIDFQEEIKTYERIIHDKLTGISELLPRDNDGQRHTDGHTRRNKRGLLPLLGIVTGIASVTNAFVTHKRLSALQYSVSALEERHFSLEESFVDLKENMLTITQLTADTLDELRLAINTTNTNLLSLTQNLMTHYARSNETFYEISGRFEGVKLMSKIVSKALRLINVNKIYYERLIRYLSDYTDSIISLLQGRIPKGIVNPRKLMDILSHAEAEIYNIEPEYTLTFRNLNHYYGQTDIIYTIQGNHLVVMIPIFLRIRSQPFLDLYRVESVHVPLDLNQTTTENKAYTKIAFEYDYFAVHGSDFVELSNTMLDNCLRFNDLYICEDTILQIHKSKMTCTSALYWDKSIETINNLCNLELYPNFSPTASILESNDKILLANLGTPWTFSCRNRHVPIRHDGHPYSVVDRNMFCKCSLTSKNYFIAAKLTGCDGKIDKMKLRYPLNGVIVSAFVDKLRREKSNVNLSVLYDTVQPLAIPTSDIKTFLQTDDSKLNEKVLDLKKVIKKLRDKTNTHKHIPQSVNRDADIPQFIMNILFGSCSIIGLLVIITTCFKYGKLYTVMMGMTMPKPTKALRNAHDVPDYPYCKIENVLIEISILIVVLLICKIVLKLYKHKCSLNLSNGLSDKCHITLEINSLFKTIYISLFSVSAKMHDVRPDRNVVPRIISLENHLLYGILFLDWQDKKIKVHNKCDYIIPNKIYIPWYKIYATKRIIANLHITRLLIQNKYTYVMGREEFNSVFNNV